MNQGSMGMEESKHKPTYFYRRISTEYLYVIGRAVTVTLSMERFQKGCYLSLVVFTKKSRKLPQGLWCIASRDKPPENNVSSFEKHCVLDLECRILSQEPSGSCILYFNVIFHGK